jgi:YHS domain-containing protein
LVLRHSVTPREIELKLREAYQSINSRVRFQEGRRGTTVALEYLEFDPICGTTVDPATAAARRTFRSVGYWFCSASCAERFDKDPELYLAP